MTQSISTFNLLHDLNKWVSPILRPKRRLSHIIDKLIESPSDIYCLNEVTPAFWAILAPKLSDKYPYHSEPMVKSRGISVAIFSKFPLKVLFQRQSLIIAYTSNLIVVSTHLTAYQQKYEVRENQLSKIVQRLRQLQNSSLQKQIREAFEKKNVIILGDLNLHLVNETLMIYKFGFYDAWIETEKEKEGYTWDPKVNSLIGWFLPFDNRRMRLDRILVRENSGIRVKSVAMDFNEKIAGTFFLFPSDHFGLTMTFDIQEGPCGVSHEEVLQKIPNKRLTGFRTMKKIKQYRKIAVVVFVILAILLLKYLY